MQQSLNLETIIRRANIAIAEAPLVKRTFIGRRGTPKAVVGQMQRMARAGVARKTIAEICGVSVATAYKHTQDIDLFDPDRGRADADRR